MTAALTIAAESISDPGAQPQMKTVAPTNNNLERIRRFHPHYVRILLVEELKKQLSLEVDNPAAPTAISVKAGGQALFTLNYPDNATFNMAQLEHVISAIDLRAERTGEIVLQQADLLTFLGASSRISAVSTPWTLELLQAVQDVTTILHSQIKFWISAPRPLDLSADVAPIIQTPPHSTFPSGHGVESFVLASMMTRFADPTNQAHPLRRDNKLMRMASRITLNRTVAGVHFPVDSMPGALMGLAIADYLFRLMVLSSPHGKPDDAAEAGADQDMPEPDNNAAEAGAGQAGAEQQEAAVDATIEIPVQPLTFVTSQFGATDFHLHELIDGLGEPDRTWIEKGAPTSVQTDPSAVLGWLWDTAAGEWPDAGGQ